MKVVDYISNYLALKEVPQIFGMSGANIEDLYTSLHRKKLVSIILAKNEYNAATMAIGSYLSTQKIGVVLTTSGPGVLNTLPVLAEAFSSRIPLILISGLIPTHLEGLGAFQDTSGKGGTFDISEMVKHCSSYHIKINHPNQIPEAMEKAFSSSLKHKRPAVILIPKDIFNLNITDYSISKKEETKPGTCPLELFNAINFCKQFSRNEHTPPLMILGEELIHLEDSTQIKEFVNVSGAAVACTANSKGVFDNNHPNFLGLVGMMGHELINQYLAQTEHVMLVGTNLDYLHRFGVEADLSSKHLLIIKEEKNQGLYKPTGATVSEVFGEVEKTFLSLNQKMISNKNFMTPTIKPLTLNQHDQQYNLKNIINQIENSIEEDAHLFIDAGNSGAFVIHHLKTRGVGACYVSLGMGGMGNSIGAGIGSAVASKKKSYIFLGDGAFLMHGLEIHTALEYNLPVVFFILNNNSHGMCSTREDLFLGGQSGINNFRESHFAEGIARFFPGVNTYDVRDLTQLESSLGEIKNKQSPCLVAINIANDENPPFKNFIKTAEVQT